METAKDKLKKITAWDSEPALSDTEIDDLLTAASIADSSGAAPSDENWDATYDISSAAANAWLIKAARAASQIEIDPDSGITSSKVFDNCRAMARMYSRKGSKTISIAPLT